MTQPPNSQSPNLPTSQITNPYVGPRTFAYEQRHLFFGREREARDLLARVLSERLLLFYAQSGAGKSSLLRTRLIPQLQEEKGFVVLPVGRVSGELPVGVAQVDNIFVFNLLLSMDEGADPARLAHVTLTDFLARLTRLAVPDLEGRERKGWVYDANATPAPAAPGSRRYALIVDQFEEIITSHPGRWREREDFFRQLDAAMRADPNLWVVLTLREDYVAALDPYAPFVADRLRARFYMERMGVAAALDAIRKPAEVAGRPFAEGVAEKLADELRQVRVAGQESTVAGQYVEPVQLQVVCYQLWENIKNRPLGVITTTDLAEAGDVDRALTQFYEETLAAALADPAAAGVSERQLRSWFDKELITEEGTRGLVHQGESDAGGLPNGVVRALQRRFLVRAEARGGDAWIELVHDRFVEPIRASNAAWFPQHLSALQRQAALWDEQGRLDGLLLTSDALIEAEQWARGRETELLLQERDFMEACKTARKRGERERRQNRLIRILAVVATVISIGAVAAVLLTIAARRDAQSAQLTAFSAEATAWVADNRAATAQAVARSALAEAESALAVSAARLEAALTAQVPPTAQVIPTPEATATPGTASPTPANRIPSATPSSTSTTTPNYTVIAQQTQLAQVRATQTVLARPQPQVSIPAPTARQPIPCAISPQAAFVDVWGEQRQRLGCAIDRGQTVSPACQQHFQGGSLFWRSDTGEVYIVFDRDKVSGQNLLTGEWFVGKRDWGWDGSNPQGLGMKPPEGLLEPVRGLGWLWRGFLGSHEGPLGWATTSEECAESQALAQEFQNGLI
ncbi:MAG: hypothetical protein WAV60_23220, partial [Anaerolineae bacterium]